MLFKRITSIRLVPIIMSILLAALLVFAITPILSESVHATPQNGGTRSGQLKNLTLRSDGSGTVRATGYSGVAGTKVSIYALPEDGYRFLKWEIPSGEGSVDNPGSASTIFTFGATDTVVQAVFIEAEQNETYVVVDYDTTMGTATATVDPNDPTTFHLTATPAAGCSFSDWIIRTGTGTIQNTRDSTTTITNCSGRVDVIAHFDGNPTCPVTATANPTAGGTAEASWNNVNYSLDVDLKATPNAGYVFKEWRINSGTGAIRNPNEAFTVLTGITGNVSCEAVFEAVTSGLYSVSLEKNNPKGGEVTASVSSGSSGTEVTLTAAPASGFRFEKWEVSAGGVTINNPSSRTATFSIGSENVIVKAVFAQPGHSVTVTSEGGGRAGASNDERMPGEHVDLYAWNTTGVHFSHWEIVSGNITLANPYDAQTRFVMGDEDVEVKCVFVPENTYCVRITNDGKGAGSPSVPSGAQNETVTLTATPNPGYMFKEWMVISKGGGTLSSTKTNPAEFTIGTGHASFRATFAEDPNYLYAIVYHLDGGKNDASNPATYTKLETITLADPKKDGHTFGGWYDNASFSGSPVTEILAGSTGDKQFYAKWTLDTYNISYQNLKGASNSNPTTYTITNTPIPLVSPTGATGYTFDGWYDNAAFSGNAITEIPANSTGDKTFYAKWTETPHQHDWKPATCTEPKTCKTCGATEGKALGHKWDAGKVTKAATEKAEGVKTFTCTVCKATKTETIPKLKPSAPKVSGTPTAKMTAKGKTSLVISWNKIQNVDGYDIFFAQCNHSGKKIACKKVKTIKGNKTFTWTKSSLKKGTAYKAYVKAYVMKNGKKSYVRTTPMMHAYTGGQTKNYTNAKSVTVNKASVTLKKGKTFKIKATVNKVNKKKKLMPKSHVATLRYTTSNSKVATVNSSGKITAKGKGTCYIYAFAHNGVSKQVKVTVK